MDKRAVTITLMVMDLKMKALLMIKYTHAMTVTHYSSHQMENFIKNIISTQKMKYFNKKILLRPITILTYTMKQEKSTNSISI